MSATELKIVRHFDDFGFFPDNNRPVRPLNGRAVLKSRAGDDDDGDDDDLQATPLMHLAPARNDQ